MTLTVGTVINHARDLHPALSAVNAPDVLAYRYLSRAIDGLYEDIARRVPAFLGTQAVVTFPLPSFAAGVDLTALIPGGWKDLLDGVVTLSNTTSVPPATIPCLFVAFEQRDMTNPVPSFTFRNNVLYFLGLDTDYAGFASFTLTYTPLANDVTSKLSVIALPDDARGPLAAMLAAFFLKRLVDDPAYKVTAKTAALYMKDAAEEERDWLTRIWRLTQRENYVIRDVMSRR